MDPSSGYQWYEGNIIKFFTSFWRKWKNFTYVLSEPSLFHHFSPSALGFYVYAFAFNISMSAARLINGCNEFSRSQAFLAKYPGVKGTPSSWEMMPMTAWVFQLASRRWQATSNLLTPCVHILVFFLWLELREPGSEVSVPLKRIYLCT